MFEILGISVGRPKPLAGTKINSSIGRENHPEVLKCFKDHITGDQIELPKYHGGPDRVLHQYSQENYDYWRSEFPDQADLFVPGSIGENMLTRGVTEKNIRIGDILRIGTVLAQVTEPRKPCGTIDQNYGLKGMHKKVESEIRCGWFYRILEVGEIKTGDNVETIERGPEEFNLQMVMTKSLMETNDHEYLLRLKNYEALSTRWRERIEKLLSK